MKVKYGIYLYCIVILAVQLVFPDGEIVISQRFAFVYVACLFITGVMACLASAKKIDAPSGLFPVLFVVFSIGLPVVRFIYS